MSFKISHIYNIKFNCLIIFVYYLKIIFMSKKTIFFKKRVNLLMEFQLLPEQ